MECRRASLISLLLLLGLALGMFGGVLDGGSRVLGYQVSDLSLQFLSWRDFGFRELAKGNLALWNPHIFGGAPYFGAMQGALLYPPNFLFLILSLPAAVNWGIALHVFGMGAFMYCWMRQRDLNIPSSFFAGALAMFSGAFFPHIFAGHLPHLNTMTWTPLIFCSIDAIFKTRSVRWCLIGMIGTAMQILAGFPQYFFYTALIAGLYSGWQLIRQPRWRIAVALLAIYLGGMALAAVQLLPAFQAARETVRGVPLPFSFASMLPFPPENFVTLLAPQFFGEISAYWGRSYLWETSLFIGVSGLAFAFYALIFCRGESRWLPLAMVLVSLLLALGVHTPLYRLLYAGLPGFDKFRSVSKFIFLASLFLVLLAATGLDRMFRQQTIARSFIVAVLSGAVLSGIGGTWVARTGSWAALMNSRQATGESFLLGQFYTNAEFIAQSQHRAALSLFVAAGVCALLSAILLWARRQPRALFAAVALGVLEVCAIAYGVRATFDSNVVQDPGEKRFLDEHPGDYRILNPINPNSAMSLGARDIWGYDASVVRRYAEFVSWTQGKDPDKATQYASFAHLDPLYAMLRLRYLFAQGENELQVADAPAPPLSQLQIISNYRVVQGRDAIFEALHSPTFDPARETILESEPDPKPVSGENNGTARLAASTTDALTIEADVQQPSILLITDTFTPSWRAVALPGSVQQHYQLQPANYILRAVPLAAGHHRFRVEYVSKEVAIGKWVSILAVVGFIGAFIRFRETRFAQ